MYVDPKKIVPERTGEYSQDLVSIRGTLNFNDANAAAGIWFATIPSNAYIYAIDAFVSVAFNGTTPTVTLGATQANANEIAAAGAIAPGTLGVQHLTTAAGLGLAVTSNTTFMTVINGAIPLYIKLGGTGATGQSAKARRIPARGSPRRLPIAQP